MHVAIVVSRGKTRAMNVAKVVDAVEIRLDAGVSKTSSQIKWDELTTFGCSLILQFFGGYANEAQELAEAS